MTSSTTGDRRWGTTRRSGMTILGKVSVPKPINLPSQRLENQGLDPNVEIVPKGTLSWGSKSSLNAWGTSSVSPRTESGPGSPSHLSNRPSSGGSVTRPSTADSDRGHESSSIGCDSSSRPSSASGVFPSNQAPGALQRPHSADTRPGSSQLSRFAEAVSETSTLSGHHVAAEKLGVATAKNDGFSLTSGDFPSLGAEKENPEKSIGPQDIGPHARPPSSSGRPVEERGVDCTKEANLQFGDANSWGRDDQPYCEDAHRYYREDSHCSQSFPNSNFPHQYDAWRGPPVNNHQGGGWYRGNHPYGVPIGHGDFQMDHLPMYPTQVPPVPGHGPGPRVNHATNETMFRPPLLDSYSHPRMQTRPGFYPGPVPYEGYYVPPIGYGTPSNRDLPFAVRPVGLHVYNKHSGQGGGGYDTPGSSVALEQNEPSHPQETQRQYKVLLKPQDGRFGEDKSRQEFLGNRSPNAEKVVQQMQTSRNDTRGNINEARVEVQLNKAENAAPQDPSLIQKIEGLNAKDRTNEESKTHTVTSGNSESKVSARILRTGHASDRKNSVHCKQGDPATNKNAELPAIGGTAISRIPKTQTKQRGYFERSDGWQKTTVMSGSSCATSGANPESFPEVNVGDSLNSIRKPGPGILSDPNDEQRSTMRELARKRAQQRQREEDERAREQRAKVFAKLEELNRRSQGSDDGSVKNLEAASNASPSEKPEDHGSLSRATMPPKSDHIHDRASLEMKTTVAAEKSVEASGESGKTLMQDAVVSSGFANTVGSTHQDNVRRDRDGNASKQKRSGHTQKQNIVFEKTTAGNVFSVVTTEVSDIVPYPEVVNEGVLSHNSEMPISTESTFTKRKNNRNGKKKHKVEETTPMNPTRIAVGKETKSGDESNETGKARADEMELGSVSVDIKVSDNTSEQISSFASEEPQNRAKNNWKSQHLRRNKPAEKFPGGNAVIWAPVHPQQKADVSASVGTQNIVPELGTSSKSVPPRQSNAKSKRVEIERYVAKPVVKEMAEQVASKNRTTAVAAVPEMPENILQKENRGGESTEILSGSPSKSRHGNGRQGKHGREHGYQRGSKALEDRQFVNSNQPTRGTVKYQSNNQTEQTDLGSAKDQTTANKAGWNDGWYMPPETQYSVETKASAAQGVAVGKDQGESMHGKQHASRSNYVERKKANRIDYNKAQMQHSCRAPADQVSGTAVTPNVITTDKYHGCDRESTRDRAYGSQRNDVTGYEHQTAPKVTPGKAHSQSQNQTTNKEVHVEQTPSNTGQVRRFGRGQENMQHHHQRPRSNRDRQKQNPQYIYKPVETRTHNGEQQFSETEGPTSKEKGQGYQRHGGQKSYEQQQKSSNAGRNIGHGLTTDERN